MTLVRQPSSTAPSRQRADIAIPQPMNRASPDAWRLQLRGSWARCQECPALLSHARRQRRSAWAAAALCRLPRRWRVRTRRPGSRRARIGGACGGGLSSWCYVVVDCRLVAVAAGCSARDLNSETRAICSRTILGKFADGMGHGVSSSISRHAGRELFDKMIVLSYVLTVGRTPWFNTP